MGFLRRVKKSPSHRPCPALLITSIPWVATQAESQQMGTGGSVEAPMKGTQKTWHC